MALNIRILTILCAVFTLGVLSPAQAQDFTPEQKAQMEEMIKNYILENGDVVLEAVDTFRIKEEAERQAQAADNIKKSLKTLTSAKAPSAGSPDAEITVVEFFDYNCGYCKRALPDVQAVLNDYENVRFVFREMPILGPTSLVASKWAMAAHKQGKYFEYHTALMEHRGQKTPAELKKLGTKLGLDAKQLEKDANSEEIAVQIEKDLEMARMVGVDGTPAFIVGDELYPGYLGEDGLKSAIESALEKGDNNKG